MAAAKIYNPDEVSIVLGPALINSGYADGEFIRIEAESEDSTDVVGSDGEVAISRTNDRRATITIILMQTADVNTQLSVLSNLFRSAPGALGGVVPFLLRDRNSGAGLYTAENAWIAKPPDISFDREATSREWMIRCADLVRIDGGNTTLGG